MTWQIEVTDTFGGEANYSWVRRYEMPSLDRVVGDPLKREAYRPESQASIMRRAKALAGYSGVRGVTTPLGEGYEFRPYGACVVLFVTWSDA